MNKQRTLTNKKGEVRELTKKDFMSMRSMDDALPKDLVGIIKKRKRGERGAQKAPTRVSLTVRYNRDVAIYFRKTGKGWQTRMNEVLEDYVWKKTHSHSNIHTARAKK